MAARAEKNRNDPQNPHAVAMQRGSAIGQRRPHQFKESERDALAGQQLAEFGYELLERPRPLRIARAVGEKDECSFSQGAIMFDAAALR